MMNDNTTSALLPVRPIYEQPLNERVRLLLRLETVFSQAILHKGVKDQYETQMCLDALFALLNLTNRYELRSELLKELERIRSMLAQYKEADGASDERVQGTLSELSQCTQVLHGLDSKHIDRIRNIDFLNTIKLRNIHDTGSYVFEIPELQFWLLQSASHRESQVDRWLNDFLPFKSSIEFILHLIRDSASPSDVVAEGGIFIKTVGSQFDTASAQQLLRIELDEGQNVYPSISGNEYRFAVRFMEKKQADERPRQTKHNVPFKLSICGV